MQYCEKCGNQQCYPPEKSSFEKGEEIAIAYCNGKYAVKHKVLAIYWFIVSALTLLIILWSHKNGAVRIFLGISAFGVCICNSFLYIQIKKNKIIMYENSISGISFDNYRSKSFETPYYNIANVQVINENKVRYLQISIKKISRKNNSLYNLEVFSCYIADPYEMMKQIQIKMNC